MGGGGVALSRFFIAKSYPEAAILESHSKVITQWKRLLVPITLKVFQMEIGSSTLGGRNCEPSTKSGVKTGNAPCGGGGDG